ncbi:MAG: 2-phosphosulfolactate phosphatase [Elainella sp.]
MFDQAEFEVRCEWGLQGILQLAPISDVLVIVDVLSFSTCVEIAVRRGAAIFPYRWKDESAQAFAASMDAEVAGQRQESRYSLSPASLLSIQPGTRLVLPSANGARLSLAAAGTPTLAGCLRNCRAIATAAQTYGQRIGVIPAGERWPDGSLRPAFEDLVGAGAVISYLEGDWSPEAQLAVAAYRHVQQALPALMAQCGSGQELIGRGFAQDVALAAELDVSPCVPSLIDGAYRDAS